MGELRGKRIFVVEDDEDISNSLVELLQEEGYEVSSASNGKTALEILQKTSKLPHLILLDLMMPVMDGFSFREKQKTIDKFSDIPVVIMSADGNVRDKQERVGAKAFLKKPVEIDAILDTVARYC